MKHATPKPLDRAARSRRKYRTDEYREWKLRYIVPKPGDGHKTPYWLADNCDKHNRKRLAADTRSDVAKRVDDEIAESEKHGTAHKLDDDMREAALRAAKISNGRASLDEIVAFWAERHPMDGNKIGLGDMVTRFLNKREELGYRPETIRELRWKLTAFKDALGEKTPVAGIWEADVERFIAGRKGQATTIRAWKKSLNSFFKYCQKEGAISKKANPAAGVEVPKPPTRKPPATWAARDVESFMRIAEAQAPDMVAGFAVLWWAGLRPAELCGQYGLEDDRIKEAKKKLKQARTNFGAERLRLGMGKGRGGNMRLLSATAEAQALQEAREELAKLVAKHGGEVMPGLQWSDIALDDADDKFISVRAESSKVKEPRHVEILPNLETWLRKYRKVGGPLVSNPTAFRRARDKVVEALQGARWSPDVCRHSFASYFYKLHGDRDRLAAMMGHTAQSREIEKHYKNATVSKADAEKYWATVPDSEKVAVETEKRTARKGA
jgi:integrase